MDGIAMFEVLQVAWVSIQYTLDSEELIVELESFLAREGIRPAVQGTVSGGTYARGFAPSDGERVRAWLLANGAELI